MSDSCFAVELIMLRLAAQSFNVQLEDVTGVANLLVVMLPRSEEIRSAGSPISY